MGGSEDTGLKNAFGYTAVRTGASFLGRSFLIKTGSAIFRRILVLIRSATLTAQSPSPASTAASWVAASLLLTRWYAPPTITRVAHATTSNGRTLSATLRTASMINSLYPILYLPKRTPTRNDRAPERMRRAARRAADTTRSSRTITNRPGRAPCFTQTRFTSVQNPQDGVFTPDGTGREDLWVARS